MNIDDAVNVLRKLPRPRLDPFFAARVAKHARIERRRSPLLALYWLAFAFFAATVLLPTMIGVPLAIVAAAIAVFPERFTELAAALMREPSS